MSILKYKDPKTGEFKRINPYKADFSFVGKDGIVVNKAADSEKVEISGSGLVQKTTTANRVYTTDKDGLADTAAVAYTPIAYGVAAYDEGGRITTNEPADNLDCTNKKYVADNYVEKLKFTNLEQALNGYILDTTKEAYADLDSAVLKNSIAVGDNVYPIADKTRALVTRIEGKTTKDENGNIYPAKISGVKFTGKNLLKLELSSTNKCNANIEGDILKITPTTQNAENIVFAEVKTHLKAGEYVFSSIDNNTNTTGTQFIIAKGMYGKDNITTIFSKGRKFTLDSESDIYILIYPCLHAELPFKAMSVQMQIQAGSQATAYEPYTEPVSVTLPETYDLHGIGDYKDYLEITKNEDNELYTLKKVQSVGAHEYTGNEAWTVGNDNMTSVFRYYCTDIEIPKSLGDKGICNKYATLTGVEDKEGVLFGSSNAYIYLFLNKTNFPDINSVKSYLSAQYAGNNPVVIYYRLSSPVETVIAKNLTYEQVTAIRHNGGLIEVEGNTNKGYARPTINNTVVYRLTATNKAEG